MAKQSAGLLVYRFYEGRLQVLLVHPGGPFWRHKDAGAWSIPKGEYEPDEDPFAAAVREFTEETGQTPSGRFIPLTPIRQAGGKIVRAWAFEGDFDPSQLKSNTFSMQWPPGSGHIIDFPEVDKAAWFDLPEAKTRLIQAQTAFIDELAGLV
ncbi:MAG: NUDIX domain-containing protein [Armatimonadota bacterium]